QAGVAVIAVCGAVAMVAYLAASRLLPLPLFGLLSYLEPLILVAVALLLGERLAPTDLAVYGLLALALLILGFEALRAPRR
ncbi:permease, partial [Glutamicibacter creatinolyticus]